MGVRTGKRTLAHLCCLLGILCALCLPCAAADEQAVRVAYFDLDDYYQIQKDGTVDSYDRAYLQRISEYTGLRFEYVNCDTWYQALDMLESHQVDLVGTMQRSRQREETFALCEESYGITVAELVALPERQFIYQDYEAIGRSVVGYAKDYVRLGDLKDCFAAHGIAPRTRVYDTQRELNSALENGEVDLIAANAHAVKEQWDVVEKFSYNSFYFATWKGNESLVRTLDEAILEINLYDSSFNDALQEQYFPVLVNSPFSKAEYDCIAKNQVYTIYFDNTVAPLAWYDASSDSMLGSLVDVCQELSEVTGLQFAYAPTDQYKEQAHTISYHTLSADISTGDNLDSGATNAVLDTTFYFYHRHGESFYLGNQEAYKVAIPENRDGIYDYMAKRYPNYQVIICDSPRTCIEQLLSGEVDLTFLNSYVANYQLITSDIKKVDAIPTTAVPFGIGLQFSGEDASVLADIVDKGILLLDAAKIQNIQLSYALSATPEVTLGYLVKTHLTLVLALSAAVLAVVGVLVATVAYAREQRREKLRVEEVNQIKSEFFSRMSHDLRTPMNGILGMLRLSEEAHTMDEVKGNLVKARSAGEYMLSLINDTLDLQRIESGKLQMDNQLFRAADLVADILDLVRPEAERKGLSFQANNLNTDLTCYIQGDPVRLKQIFVNLLSNAVKFTPEGGTVEWRMERLRLENGVAFDRFQVRDTGVGMSAAFIRDRLYNPYSQEQNKMTNQYAGSGLGLAITKSLVEMMGGRIEVESELGEGTCFTLYLKFQRQDGAAAVKTLEEQEKKDLAVREKLRGKRILLCEDHPLNAEIARRLLEKVGCEVVWANDGEKGLACFRTAPQGHFDAILMDIRMPVMNGLEAAAHIRSLERQDAKTVPILAMTANAYAEDVQKSLGVGMNAHLAKPIEPQVLYDKLVKFLV